MQSSRVAIIIPTYNEKSNIKLLTQKIFKVLPRAIVLVVDDNSPDSTAVVVKKLQTKFPNLWLIEGEKKSGRGQAVLKGMNLIFNKTKMAVFVEMDADFSHRPQELLALIKAVRDKNVALASRYVAGGAISNWPWQRKILSFVANKLIGLVLGLPLKDNTNGFRAYSRQAVAVLLKNSPTCKSYLFLSECALVLQKAGFTFKELSSHFPNRRYGVSNTNLREAINNLRDLIFLKIKLLNVK